MKWDQLVTLGLELPEAVLDIWYRTPALKVRDKGFARLRTEAEGLLVLMCRLDEKEAVLAAGDPAFTTTPHYDGYGAILVDLDRIDRDRLAEAVRDAWWEKAPAALRKQVEAGGT